MTGLQEGYDLRSELPAMLGPLRAHARALCRNPTLADDLVQEAVLRALRAEAQLQPGTSPRAWVFTILRNVWLEGLRRARHEQGEASAPQSQAAEQPGRMDLHGLQTAMDSLPLAQREALLLVGAQGMSVAEAAQVCGVPEGTVKARLSRGRARLRIILAAGAQGGSDGGG